MVWAPIAALLPLIAAGGAPRAQSDADYDHGSIGYSKTAPTDPVARLAQRFESGAVKLEVDGKHGYLPAILRELNIPTTSQSLVFSKTSFQFTQIFPSRPRALYFNEDVYVGYVQGSPLLEFAAVDPKLGAVFYAFDTSEEKPRFVREIYACLLCHDSTAITGGIPGFMTLSVTPDPEGNALRTASTAPMSDQTPFNERWGGWYVTGTHGDRMHRGNTTVPIGALLSRVDWAKGGNLRTLNGMIDTDPYLTPYSDIVALIALTHQSRIHNLVTRANYETQRAVADEENAYKGLARPGARYSPLTAERIRGAVEPLVRGMFFANEAPLEAPVRGVSGYTAEFEKSGVRDRKGRSLKDLDLNRRFLRHPLSYLIYTEAFDALPLAAREYFYERARTILSGADATQGFSHLSADDRTAIREILEDTKPEFRTLGGG
jgi:hypothetical protein